jgi:hypothetical protein
VLSKCLDPVRGHTRFGENPNHAPSHDSLRSSLKLPVWRIYGNLYTEDLKVRKVPERVASASPAAECNTPP